MDGDEIFNDFTEHSTGDNSNGHQNVSCEQLKLEQPENRNAKTQINGTASHPGPPLQQITDHDENLQTSHKGRDLRTMNPNEIANDSEAPIVICVDTRKDQTRVRKRPYPEYPTKSQENMPSTSTACHPYPEQPVVIPMTTTYPQHIVNQPGGYQFKRPVLVEETSDSTPDMRAEEEKKEIQKEKNRERARKNRRITKGKLEHNKVITEELQSTKAELQDATKELKMKDQQLVVLKQQHAEEIKMKDQQLAALKQQHAEEIKMKDQQLAVLKQQHAEEIKKEQREIEEERDKYKFECAELKGKNRLYETRFKESEEKCMKYAFELGKQAEKDSVNTLSAWLHNEETQIGNTSAQEEYDISGLQKETLENKSTDSVSEGITINEEESSQDILTDSVSEGITINEEESSQDILAIPIEQVFGEDLSLYANADWQTIDPHDTCDPSQHCNQDQSTDLQNFTSDLITAGPSDLKFDKTDEDHTTNNTGNSRKSFEMHQKSGEKSQDYETVKKERDDLKAIVTFAKLEIRKLSAMLEDGTNYMEVPAGMYLQSKESHTENLGEGGYNTFSESERDTKKKENEYTNSDNNPESSYKELEEK